MGHEGGSALATDHRFSTPRRGHGNAASRVLISSGLRVTDSAAAFSLVWGGEPDSGIAMTFPLRMTQARAMAAAEQLWAAPIWIRVLFFFLMIRRPPRG